MPLDKWGLPFFYPTKPSGFEWFQEDDIKKDSHVDSAEVGSSGGGSFTANYSGPTSVVIYTDPAFQNTNAIGGCNMDFTQTEQRGYVYKSNDPKNIELKFIMSTDLNGGFSVSQTAGKHSGSGCCSGFAYMINMECQGSPTAFRFRKEMWHVSYHTDPTAGDFTHSLFNFQLNGHGNVGIGFVKYLKHDGVSSGHDSVILEFWGNPNPDNNPEDWTLIKKIEDKGGWGNDGDQCNGNKDQVGAWGMPKFRLKSNSEGSITFKHMSLREIDPTLSFDDIPDNPPPGEEPPTTTTVQGQFKFEWDLNTTMLSACQGTGGGGAGGSSIFYTRNPDNDKEVGTASDRTTAVTEGCNNSSSVFSGKLIQQLDIPLKKVGSPAATPVVSCKIWNSSRSVVYTSPTTFDPSTFTTSYVTKSFDFSTNTHIMVTGDIVGIEYTGNSDNDYIVCAYQDGTDTKETYWHYDVTIPGWREKTLRDLACDVWQ